jgi:hypothetical protein
MISYLISYLYLRYAYPPNTTALATHVTSDHLEYSPFSEPSGLSITYQTPENPEGGV